MTEKAKRKITNFNFESEGAHLAMVDKAANLQEVLVMKAVEPLEKNSQSSAASQDEDVVKAEDETETQKEVSKTMTDKTEVTQESLEEQINKAAESIVAKRLEEIEKAANEKVEKVEKQLEVFKAREESREKQEYLAKAEGFAKYLGEEADKESIAKALKAVEGTEEAKPVMDILKALKDMAEKDEEGIFKEIGQSATQDQPEGQEAKIEALQKSLMKEEGISEHAAYVKAADQVREESK